jgi:hypothetical protein
MGLTDRPSPYYPKDDPDEDPPESEEDRYREVLNREAEDRESADWYILGAHARRALGYLGAALAQEGFKNFQQLLDLWGEALERTMDPDERSPVGAGKEPQQDPEYFGELPEERA